MTSDKLVLSESSDVKDVNDKHGQSQIMTLKMAKVTVILNTTTMILNVTTAVLNMTTIILPLS